MHEVAEGQLRPAGTKQGVGVATQAWPPLVVVYVAPDGQPDAPAGSDPVATHAPADGQATAVRAPAPASAPVHVAPPSVVEMTVLPPTAVHVLAAGHEMALSVPTPLGTPCCTQVVPPSDEVSTMPVLSVVSPTATHSVVVGHATAVSVNEEVP